MTMNTLARAIALYQAGNRAAAATVAQEIAAGAAGEDLGDACNLLAVIALDDGCAVDAESHARRAMATEPGNPVYLNTLGNILLAQGRSDEALVALTTAHGLAPAEPDILFNLANAQRRAGRDQDAVESYRGCIALKPGHIAARNNLAVLLKAQGDAEGAATVLIEAVAHAPTSAELRFNLGNALLAAGRLDGAEAAYRRTISLRPRHSEAHANLGVVLAESGRKTEAETSFRAAIAINPDLEPAYVGLADLVDEGSGDDIAHRRAVLALKPDLAAIRSSLLMCMQYSPAAGRAQLFAEHQAYGAMFPAPTVPAYAVDHDFSVERPLRLGVVSGDFRSHAMAFFALPVFAARDSADWYLTGYSTTAKPDAVTQEFRAAADAWRDVRDLSTTQLVELIVRDRIDVLIDLSGHARNTRLPVFAAKPAPLQVAWGDYVDTRGLSTIDILLGDSIQTPPEDDRYYTERVVRFAPDYFCYRPPAYAPPVAPAPCLTQGGLTFGCFSEITKIGPAAVAIWAAVMNAIPNARFLFNNRLLADATRQQHLIQLFRDHGIGSDRLMFRTGGAHAAFLAQYADIDVVLDTTPYSGGLTTCEALLMGVPVLTIPGDRFCGRHAAVHLTHGGYPEGVARSVDDLVAKAKHFAADPNALDELRMALRDRFLKSTVCDVPRFAAAFYGTLRNEWHKLCATRREK
ncbi:MAG: glycosyltransferase family 41 protein [Rhodospirillaceae bacterium]|nr:MAG: glycosyltransferase family 41 protein [Rhodospirillaceae bacterium]